MSRTRASPRVARWWSTAESRRARPASGGSSTSAESCSTTTPGTRRTGASPSSCSWGRSRSPCQRRRKRSRRRRRPPLPRRLGRSLGLGDLFDQAGGEGACPRKRTSGGSGGTGRFPRVDGSLLDLRNRFDKPNRYTGRPQGARISAGVARPSIRDQLAVPLDAIVEAEARPANVAAPRGDHEPVVETGRRSKADVGLERQRLDALGLQRRVAAAKAG